MWTHLFCAYIGIGALLSFSMASTNEKRPAIIAIGVVVCMFLWPVIIAKGLWCDFIRA